MRKRCCRDTVCLVFFYALACMGICQWAQGAAFAQPADDQQMHLSLIQAIQMGLVNNKDIELARQNVMASDWDLKGVVALKINIFNVVHEFVPNALQRRERRKK